MDVIVEFVHDSQENGISTLLVSPFGEGLSDVSRPNFYVTPLQAQQLGLKIVGWRLPSSTTNPLIDAETNPDETGFTDYRKRVQAHAKWCEDVYGHDE